MNNTLYILFLFFISASMAMADNVDCSYFYKTLKSFPHTDIKNTQGKFKSLWNNQAVTGCMVFYKSTDKLLSGAKKFPDFRTMESSDLFKDGWYEDYKLAADGPGSSLHGIRKDNILCFILHDQDAYHDEKTGEIIQSEIITTTVQCSKDKSHNKSP
jgi:phage gp46-like protein